MQQIIPDYQTLCISKSYYNHKNGTESHEMPNIAYVCMYLNITRQKHSEQDYEAIPGPKSYTSAVYVHYNCVASMGEEPLVMTI